MSDVVARRVYRAAMRDDNVWTEADDIRYKFAPVAPEHPVAITQGLITLLLDGAAREELAEFVTPEGRSDWGDFSAAIEFAAQMEGPRVSDYVRAAPGAPDVVYTRVVLGVSTAQIFTVETPMYAHNVNLVWRPKVGGWKFHQISDEQLDPHLLPRASAPGAGPDIANR